MYVDLFHTSYEDVVLAFTLYPINWQTSYYVVTPRLKEKLVAMAVVLPLVPQLDSWWLF